MLIQFTMMQMILAILSVMSQEKLRLYTPRTHRISVSHKRSLPSWYSGHRGAMERSRGKDLVRVDIPMSLLSFSEKVSNPHLGCDVYVLKGAALRYAKRSCR